MIIYILKTKERENVNIELWGGMIKKMLCMKCSSQNWWIKGLPEYALTPPLVQSKPSRLHDLNQQNPLKLAEFQQINTQEAVPWPVSEAMSKSHVFFLILSFWVFFTISKLAHIIQHCRACYREHRVKCHRQRLVLLHIKFSQFKLTLGRDRTLSWNLFY